MILVSVGFEDSAQLVELGIMRSSPAYERWGAADTVG